MGELIVADSGNESGNLFKCSEPGVHPRLVAGGDLPIAVEWDFGDGSDRPTELSTVHTYTTSGSYLARVVESRLIVDLRNIYQPAKLSEAGIRYVSLGRETAEPGEGGSGA